MKSKSKAIIIADSVSPSCKRVVTFQLRYWRAIHAEVMTHRVFSRNASSSRAIPISRTIAQVLSDPAGPCDFRENQKGMQAGSPLRGVRGWLAEKAFYWARYPACAFAWSLGKLGVHKQYANRLLEPWQWISVVVTSTEWENFFALRCHPAAQPEIQALALQMRACMTWGVPRIMQYGDWHTPYVTQGEIIDNGVAIALQMSVARCARVSYNGHDGKKTSVADDVALYTRLVCAEPMHGSPLEHQARPAADPDHGSGNLRGWVQYRKLVESSKGNQS